MSAAQTHAALPMYDRPETREANTGFWSNIRHALREDMPDLPVSLSLPADLWEHWLSPDLAFSQTCGLPLVDRLRGKVTVLGTPDYGLPGCLPGYYNSVFVVRTGDTRSEPADWPRLRLAVNSRNAQSGWCAPQNFMGKRGLAFTNVLLTGSHRRSAEAVARGDADIACIDAFTWSMIRRWDGVASALEEIGRTDPTPGLPYITAPGRAPAPMTAAIEGAIASLTPEDRDLLGLRGLVQIPFDAYDAVQVPPFPRASARKIA